ncbi:MAG TPA: amidase [Terriglobales bacterium]|jgi:Asp-tRNA(Asn)/Glu-tRNA(Gln) amidotransferase A subunit family amidase|nr:amidase [Terriglobales bacterium]
MSDLTSLSAAEMAEQIRKRAYSPVELVQAHYDRIRQKNSALNAFVDLNEERALKQAKSAESAVMRGESLGPLHGVPVSIKSSIDVAGMRCEAGTRLRAGNVATHDAPLVARLRQAGAIVLGVTNTPELLMAWETDNLLYGRTNNPWDPTLTAGGSSGGESAAIASGMSAGGVGSDGGGSIRVPAHFTGICGLKPTPGRIPCTGHFPPSGGPFALLGVVGPMARTIVDLELLFRAMAGPDDGDPSSAPVPPRTLPSDELMQTRVGWFEDDGRTPVTYETRLAIQASAQHLKRAGFEVEPFRPTELETARQLWWKFFGVAGGMILGPMLKGYEREISPILSEFTGWVREQPSHTGETLLSTWLGRDEVRGKFLNQMRHFPILLCPAAAIPAFKHRERSWSLEGKTVEYLDAWSYTEWFNLLGFPAVVVPMGHSPEGLPIGVQVVGRPWEEELVLQVAATLEAERGYFPLSPLQA